MATDNNNAAPSTPLLEEQKVEAQPQHVPKPRRRSQKSKQIQDSSMSAKSFHPGNKMSFSQSDLQGLLGSSGVRLQENPKLLEDSGKERDRYRPGPSVFVPPVNSKLLEDLVKETSSYHPGQSVIVAPENSKLLEDSVKETSRYRPGPSVIVPPENSKLLEDSGMGTSRYRRVLVPPMISEQSLRKGKQKQIKETFPPTFPQMNLASQPSSASSMNGTRPSTVSQMNLLWLLQQQMQLSRTYEKRPAVVPDIRSIYTPGTCDQRLKQYIYCQRQRPRDNNIEFLGNLVAEFFAPNAKKRLCLSSNKNKRQISGIFPQDAWCCEICNVRPTAGFEINAEVLPRLTKIKFETGMTDELLCMDIAEECYTPSGHIVLNYAKVTEESVYEAARVVREGRLRIVFSSDLKICIWEFCCSSHEVYIDRRSVTPQAHQLKEAIEKYQVFAESSTGISTQEFQRNSNKFASSVRELARSLDKSFINDFGYTRRYVRCLQISEIVNSMKDLMDYSKKYGIGPSEAMAMIHHESTASRVAHNSVAGQGPQQRYIDDATSHNSSVISFAPYPSTDEGIGSFNCSSPRATSPTSSTASSKRLVNQADFVEPRRKKQRINSGESSVVPAPT